MNHDETIYLKAVLKEMRTPNQEGRAVLFDIAFRTFNRYSGTGGQIRRYQNAKLVMKEKPLDPTGVEALKYKKKKVKRVRKNPHHWENKTRNIRLETGEIKKIHIYFITEFNGKKVIY